MFTQKNKPLRLGTGLLAAFALAATLTACGGGGDDPASTAGASGSYQQAGTLNYLVYSPDGTTRTVNATVAGTSPNWTLTFSELNESDLDVSTTDNWANVTWPKGYAGSLALSGNAGLVCDTSIDFRQVGVSGNLVQVSAFGQVGVSGNLVRVTDLTLLRGKSFTLNECADGSVAALDVVTFNQDGTADVSDSKTSTVTAAEVTSLFSENGLLFDGTTEKLRAFSRTVGGQTEYVLVAITDDVYQGGRTQTVALYVQNTD